MISKIAEVVDNNAIKPWGVNHAKTRIGYGVYVVSALVSPKSDRSHLWVYLAQWTAFEIISYVFRQQINA